MDKVKAALAAAPNFIHAILYSCPWLIKFRYQISRRFLESDDLVYS